MPNDPQATPNRAAAADPWLCCLPLDRCTPETKKHCIYCSLMADKAYRERVIKAYGHIPHVY